MTGPWYKAADDEDDRGLWIWSGISAAVARKFGAAGFRVALVARSRDKIADGVRSLEAAGVTAAGFTCDLGDPDAVRTMIAEARAALGSITVIHYNAYAGTAGDLLTADADDMRKVYDVSVTGLATALQAALPDMKEQTGVSAVLVTGGGFAFYDEKVDAMVVRYGAMGLGVAKAAQHKLVGILHQRLAPEGIYVGEVIVLGMVKGTAFDAGNATVLPETVAEAFYTLYERREEATVRVG